MQLAVAASQLKAAALRLVHYHLALRYLPSVVVAELGTKSAAAKSASRNVMGRNAPPLVVVRQWKLFVGAFVAEAASANDISLRCCCQDHLLRQHRHYCAVLHCSGARTPMTAGLDVPSMAWSSGASDHSHHSRTPAPS